jgi:hypothetical protein
MGLLVGACKHTGGGSTTAQPEREDLSCLKYALHQVLAPPQAVLCCPLLHSVKPCRSKSPAAQLQLNNHPPHKPPFLSPQPTGQAHAHHTQHLPGGTLKLMPSTSSRSPKDLTSPSTSSTLPPRRGPTGMVMESTVLLRT